MVTRSCASNSQSCLCPSCTVCFVMLDDLTLKKEKIWILTLFNNYQLHYSQWSCKHGANKAFRFSKMLFQSWATHKNVINVCSDSTGQPFHGNMETSWRWAISKRNWVCYMAKIRSLRSLQWIKLAPGSQKRLTWAFHWVCVWDHLGITSNNNELPIMGGELTES